MTLREVLGRRRMCRNFTDEAVPSEIVDRLLDQARRAPSAGNTQGWAFLVLEERGQVDQFWRADADPGWLREPTLPGVVRAPVIIIPLYCVSRYLERYSEPDKIEHGMTTEDAWPAQFWVVDVAFATMILLLSAVEEGLGALFFGLRGEPRKLHQAFGIPDGWSAIGAVALGWPSEERGPVGSATRGRRELSEVVHRGRW